MSEEVATTLGAVALGWVLSELSQRFRVTGLHRVAAGQALAELLELRHYLKGIQLALDAVQELVRLSPEQSLATMGLFEFYLPADPGLPERYNRALSQIAGGHPMLAFRLRSKEHFPQILAKMRTLQAANAKDIPADLASEVDSFLRSIGLDAIDDSIRELACSHGVRTWWRVRRLLKKPAELPQELRLWLDRIKETMSAQQGVPPVGA